MPRFFPQLPAPPIIEDKEVYDWMNSVTMILNAASGHQSIDDMRPTVRDLKAAGIAGADKIGVNN